MDKRHVLGMSINPQNDFYRLKLCRLSCTLITNTPSKIPLPGWHFFWACKTPTQNSEISHGRTLRHTDSGLLFQTWSKSVQDKCPKGCVVLATKKQNTFRRCLAEPLERFATLIFDVSSKFVQVWGVIIVKPFRNPKVSLI